MVDMVIFYSQLLNLRFALNTLFYTLILHLLYYLLYFCVFLSLINALWRPCLYYSVPEPDRLLILYLLHCALLYPFRRTSFFICLKNIAQQPQSLGQQRQEQQQYTTICLHCRCCSCSNRCCQFSKPAPDASQQPLDPLDPSDRGRASYPGKLPW